MIRELEILRVLPTEGCRSTEVEWCWRKYPEAQDIVDVLDIEEILDNFIGGEK